MNFIQTLDRKQPKGKFIRPDLKLTSELNMPFYWLIINAVCCLVAFYLTNSGKLKLNSVFKAGIEMKTALKQPTKDKNRRNKQMNLIPEIKLICSFWIL